MIRRIRNVQPIGKRFLSLIISVTYFAAHRLLTCCGWSRPPRRVVLTYHVVNPDEVVQFDWQMRQLTRTVMPAFADDPDSREPSAAVTFDDAFEDVIGRTLPVLARHGIPATIFVPTGYMGAAPGWARAQSCGDDSRVASPHLLKNLDRRLVRLGSHTVTHRRLGTADESCLTFELATSKQTLEELTGELVRSLALPYGSYSAAAIVVARKAGYDHVFANVPLRSNGSATSSLRGRVDVSVQDWRLEFYLKLHGAYDWMAVAIPVKRQLLTFLGKRQEA